jgi:hypothetical protein
LGTVQRAGGVGGVSGDGDANGGTTPAPFLENRAGEPVTCAF